MTFVLSPSFAKRWQPICLFSRWLRFIAFLAASFASGHASAQISGLDLPAQAPWQVKELAFLGNQPFDQTIDKVATGQAGAFTPLTSNDVNNPHWYRSVWVRIHLVPLPSQSVAQSATRVPATAENTILMGLGKPYLDDLILFTPQGEQWQQQRGGDMVARSDWTSATRGLMPRFAMPTGEQVAQAGEQGLVLYFQIKCLVPLRAAPQWLTQADCEAQDFRILVALCLCFGAMWLMTLTTLVTAWMQRSWLYAWYGLYSLAASVATASHSGLLHHILWPVGGQWPGLATMIALLLACLCQVYFCRHVLLRRHPDARLSWLSHGIAVLTVILLIWFMTFPTDWTGPYFGLITQILSCVILCGIWMVRLAWANEHLAKAWIAAFIPMYITIFIAVLDGVGLITDSAWTHTFSLLAAALEVVILGVVLQFFARNKYGEKERQLALASTDPLTGFVGAEAFQNRLLSDWQAKETQTYDMAVIYIQLQTKAQDAAHLERLLVRSVRILRSATHTHDLVARLGGQLMAILMPHTDMGDDLNQRLSRMVALGLMPDRSDPMASILQFRIAATTRSSYTQPLTQLDADMRRLLAEPRGWGSKPIRYINSSATKRKKPDTSDLDSIWERALYQQEHDTHTPLKPST